LHILRIFRTFAAALLCALLVDSEEGNRRAIAIDPNKEQKFRSFKNLH